ncbi:ParA family protein [Pseudoalteromonas prydzensis]|uniref:ParA family protein n=1 Tax=Pseudoalteromonas prydzensis TaxID=182141 RepID=UPI003FD12196
MLMEIMMMSEVSAEKTLLELSVLAGISRGRLNEIKAQQLKAGTNENREFRTYSKAEAQAWLNIKHTNTFTRNLKALENSDNPIQFERESNGHYKFTIQDLHKIADAMEIPRFERKDGDKCQVLALSNLKGGAGKSTASVHIATGLALNYNKRYRVAFIDLDPQGTGTMFGVPDLSDDDFSVGDIMQGNYELSAGESEKEFVKSCFKDTHIPNLHYLPGRVSDFFFESVAEQMSLASSDDHDDKSRVYRILKERIIDAVSDDFDIIILDTAPSLNKTFYNAIYAATTLFIPVIPELVAFDATLKYLERLKEIYQVVAEAGHEGLDYIRLLVTNLDYSGNPQTITVHRTYFQDLKNLYSDRALSYPIKHSKAIPICADNFMTVFEMRPAEYSKSRTQLQSAVTNLSDVIDEIEALCCQAWPSTASKII